MNICMHQFQHKELVKLLQLHILIQREQDKQYLIQGMQCFWNWILISSFYLLWKRSLGNPTMIFHQMQYITWMKLGMTLQNTETKLSPKKFGNKGGEYHMYLHAYLWRWWPNHITIYLTIRADGTFLIVVCIGQWLQVSQLCLIVECFGGQVRKYLCWYNLTLLIVVLLERSLPEHCQWDKQRSMQTTAHSCKHVKNKREGSRRACETVFSRNNCRDICSDNNHALIHHRTYRHTWYCSSNCRQWEHDARHLHGLWKTFFIYLTSKSWTSRLIPRWSQLLMEQACTYVSHEQQSISIFSGKSHKHLVPAKWCWH